MENLDLANYIEQARKSGMGDNKIREGLLQAGWSVSSVEEAIMSKENPKSEVLNPKQDLKIQNSKTSIRNAIFAILVLGISVTGYFTGAYYMSKFQSFPLWPFEPQVLVPTFTPKPQVSPSTSSGQSFDFAQDWLIYRSEEYGFEFRYPAESTIKLNEDGTIFLPFQNLINGKIQQTGSLEIENEGKLGSYELKDYCTYNKDKWFCRMEPVPDTDASYSTSREEITLNGYTALKIGLVGIAVDSMYLVESPTGNVWSITLYDMTFGQDPESSKKLWSEIDQILSTFRFTR